MKGNIKKLAILVIITVMVPFIMAAMASAGSPGHHAIRGQYAYTGETTCLFSPSGFNANLQPNAGWGIIQTYSREGVFTFEPYGTGSAHINPSRAVALPYTIPSPPAPVLTPVPPNGGTQDITFDFTYTFPDNGKITIIVDPGTFISTQLTGPDAGRIFRIEGVLTDGVITPILSDGAITPDGKTITLNSGAPDVYKITRLDAPGPTNYSICHSSSVLIWQHE